MPEPLLISLAVICIIVGAIGTVAPILPGVPLSWAGLLILKFVPSVKDNVSWAVIVILGIITVVVTVLDNILPMWGTKKMGGNKVKPALKQASGAFLGYISGLVIKLITVGLIVFFFVAALV